MDTTSGSQRTLAQARALFPVIRRWAYFNAAANAPLADPVRAAVEAYLRDLGEHGSAHYASWGAAAREARALAARLIGADPGEVALVHNTSEGINIVASGLAFRPRESVVVVHGDFPANVIPWLNLRSEGVDVRFVRPDPENRVSVDGVLEQCDASTRLVSVSAVAFTNGFRIDWPALGRALRARGVLFFVDAIQALGHLPLDVRADHIDFLAADGHKWMLGPEGIGVFYVRRELLPSLRLRHVSWLSMKDPFDNERYEFDPQDDARRFEYGSPNTAGIHALRAALELLGEVGVDRIAAHDVALATRAATGLSERGWRVRSPLEPESRSGIIGFDREGARLGEVERRLLDAGVQVARRGGMLRVACHLYNDESDVERLLEALPP